MNNEFSSRRGLTLIELLTVLAVVAILAAILIPTVGRVRMMGNRAASASNLRQWGTAIGLYQADHRGHLPVEGGGSGKSGSLDRADYAWWSDVGAAFNEKAWFNVLPPYASARPLKDLLPGSSAAEKDAFFRNFRQSLFYSPGSTLREAGSGTTAGMVPMCYFINSQLYNSEAAAVHGQSAAQLRARGVKMLILSQARSPSAVPLMAEARTENTELAAGQKEDAKDVFRARGQARHVGSRYGKTTNVLFADGSVRNFQTSYILAKGPAGSGLRDEDKPDLVWRPFLYVGASSP